ncbi:hypothetical protein [Affinirhizobium pseudoryzae]|jgi:hypothetical protein|uniref:hypothetical protein n=1 Tax=Allorhizobium pseudoryzae TaxID=379684 RepID=UPI0013EBCAA0|nr:hypothetical protein [Allorhizobium pseudoryzae]
MWLAFVCHSPKAIKKNAERPCHGLEQFLEIIYKLRNHASGRRDFHFAPDLKFILLVRTAEMVVPAS